MPREHRPNLVDRHRIARIAVEQNRDSRALPLGLDIIQDSDRDDGEHPHDADGRLFATAAVCESWCRMTMGCTALGSLRSRKWRRSSAVSVWWRPMRSDRRWDAQWLPSRPLSYRATTIRNLTAYRVNGAPADCVALGAHHWERVDLVLSGLNHGLNLGNSIWHSGTLAAAKQAALLGIRGIALSAPAGAEPDFAPFKPWIRRVIETLSPDLALPLVNVNFPRQPRGLVWTRASVRQYDGRVVPTRGSARPRSVLVHCHADRGRGGRNRSLGGGTGLGVVDAAPGSTSPTRAGSTKCDCARRSTGRWRTGCRPPFRLKRTPSRYETTRRRPRSPKRLTASPWRRRQFRSSRRPRHQCVGLGLRGR